MTTCIITRAQPGAMVTSAEIVSLGLSPIIIPAAIIKPTLQTISVENVQALLMTSGAAARSIISDDLIRAVPVYAVGDATAEAATQAGFETVISAGGDGATLAVLAADRMNPTKGALLHLRGTEVAGDVTGMLTACGFETRFVEVYETQDHPEFRCNVGQALRGEGGMILLHSPAGARRLVIALDEQKLDLRRWLAVGLSQACLSPLENKGFGGLSAAMQPDEDAMMEVVSLHATQIRP
jgi:uroporphyrinogen-III synthase